MRILGLDWGTVRIGAAMSDEEQKLAFPLQHTIDAKVAVEEIKKLVDEYGISKIIIGMPLSLSGSESQSSEKVKKFANTLEKKIGIKAEFIDERFSTTGSTKALREQNIKEKQQREIKDNIAAALMLQQYLDKKI